MSFVTIQPAAMTVAAGHLAAIGSAMTASNSAVAEPTTAIAPAAADEVSALTAAAFTAHGVLYQEVSAQAAAIHQLFVSTLQASAGSYAATEAANAAAAR
ncbi:PE family protein [Mycobacterium sp.]|uniref:PE family protein n=1 Tax=Mycobacterium sp. TaxID=1785 RepID=UPI003F960A47